MLGHSEFIKKTILQQPRLGARALKPSQKWAKLHSMKYIMFTLNFFSIVGLKITQECWLLLKDPTSFNFRPCILLWDHFEVFQGQKMGKKCQNRLKLAKMVISSFIYTIRRFSLKGTLQTFIWDYFYCYVIMIRCSRGKRRVKIRWNQC